MKTVCSLIKLEGTEKERAWDLLLLADPSREMVLRYLHRGTMLALVESERIVGEAVYSARDELTCELHNLAVIPEEQGKGYGIRLLKAVCDEAARSGRDLIVGTAVLYPGEKTFYEKQGFVFSHVVPGFFTDNYDPPPVDDGIECVDMTYFRKEL